MTALSAIGVGTEPGGETGAVQLPLSRRFCRTHLVLAVPDAWGPSCTGGAQVEPGQPWRLFHAPGTDRVAIWNASIALAHADLDLTVAETLDAEPLAELIDKLYPDEPGAQALSASEASSDASVGHGSSDLLELDGKGDVVRLVDELLLTASRMGASDLHVQPTADAALVRLRVDGVLHTLRELSPSAASPLISRIKVMGRMDIAERRLPQDGRASVSVGGDRSIDLRISTLPTSHGERAVIRLLEDESRRGLADLSSLGMPAGVRETYLDRASRTNGVILLTGPTGSGKTTTLYATLRWLAERSRGELNIMTVEDPIEFAMATRGLPISQTQVNRTKGVTFASGLRHILRQDPDVVMVGEIRDAETARIAIQAALTGHLVFSTLHTNDAPSAVARLLDLGVEPYLVASSLSAVLAQRLVRAVHQECGGVGCPGCLGSGFKGRTGLFELMAVDEAHRSQITNGASSTELRSTARAAGLRDLIEEGRRLVAEGITTESEVLRVAAGGAA